MQQDREQGEHSAGPCRQSIHMTAARSENKRKKPFAGSARPRRGPRTACCESGTDAGREVHPPVPSPASRAPGAPARCAMRHTWRAGTARPPRRTLTAGAARCAAWWAQQAARWRWRWRWRWHPSPQTRTRRDARGSAGVRTASPRRRRLHSIVGDRKEQKKGKRAPQTKCVQVKVFHDGPRHRKPLVVVLEEAVRPQVALPDPLLDKKKREPSRKEDQEKASGKKRSAEQIGHRTGGEKNEWKKMKH